MKRHERERQGRLLALLVAVAVGVIVLSALSTAAIVGWIPAAYTSAPFAAGGPPSM